MNGRTALVYVTSSWGYGASLISCHWILRRAPLYWGRWENAFDFCLQPDYITKDREICRIIVSKFTFVIGAEPFGLFPCRNVVGLYGAHEVELQPAPHVGRLCHENRF